MSLLAKFRVESPEDIGSHVDSTASIPERRISMATMLKLRLSPESATLSSVMDLPGMQSLSLDAAFGVVCISPKAGLYVVRADNVDDLEDRKKQSPEILEAYGEVRIASTKLSPP